MKCDDQRNEPAINLIKNPLCPCGPVEVFQIPSYPLDEMILVHAFDELVE